LPFLAAVVWLGGWPFAIVAGAVALLAAAEFVHGWLIPTMPLRMVLPQAPTFGAAAMMVAGAAAQTAPVPVQPPLRLIVPFTPGTGIDIVARTVGPRLG